jgi:hypothetical protein
MKMPTKGTGRGKKKVDTHEQEGVVPIEVVTAAAAAAPAMEDVVTPPPVAPPTAAPKKRVSTSKKPVKVIAVVTPDGIEGSFVPEPRRPLIAHLQVRSSELLFDGSTSQPSHNANPSAYDPTESNPFQAQQERFHKESAEGDILQEFDSGDKGGGGSGREQVSEPVHIPSAAASNVVVIPAAKSMPCFTRSELMIQFKDASEQKRLPDTTDIACFWCAHSFEGMPCIIPEREVNAIYTVYGNFCCPECAMSYLLCESLDPHVRWERMSLLQRIYDVGGNGRIMPAPCRESLKMFGGPMTIEVFRATIREKKVRVDLHMPPMVSILGSIDTKPIDFFDTTLKQGGPITAVPAAAQRAGEEGLRLKRTKPLKDKESTLDTVMNIKIGNNSLFGRAH